ncbi:MAG: hypothetical protein EOR91_32845 [Mesorhizobium sp.]|nr:MAG: hypothetical protein EOR91_32845 [Mesorhizobium sp.]
MGKDLDRSSRQITADSSGTAYCPPTGMRGSPYQIRASDLEDERLKADLARNTQRRINDDNQESLFSAI